MRRIVVRRSPVHGRGVFALTNIPSGEFVVEYKGEVTSWRVASERYERDCAEDGHTFFTVGYANACGQIHVILECSLKRKGLRHQDRAVTRCRGRYA
jgi:SET domain-containing protein